MKSFKNLGETRFVRGLRASHASSRYQSLQLNCMNIKVATGRDISS